MTTNAASVIYHLWPIAQVLIKSAVLEHYAPF